MVERIASVAKRGKRLATLKATRQRVAEALEFAAPNEVAALAGRLQAILAEIDALEAMQAPKAATAVDEVNRRREERERNRRSRA